MVCPKRLSSSAIILSCSTASFSSALKPFIFPILLGSSPKIFLSFTPGINLATLSASYKGKSSTLAVSLTDDFAAMVP